MASTASKRHRKQTPAVPAQLNGHEASESSDDYLKAILELSGPEDRQGRAQTSLFT
jgi:hypothetical protein